MSSAALSALRRLAWPVAVLSVILTIAGFVVSSAATENGTLGDQPALSVVVLVGIAGLASMGALIASRTGNPIGWILLGIVTSLTLSFLGSAYGEVAVSRELTFGGFALTVLAEVPLFVGLGLFPAVFLLFPTGDLPSPRWRPVGWVYGIAFLVLIAGFTLLPIHAHEGGVSVTNPLAIAALEGVLGPILAVTGFLLLGCALASLIALIVRYRGSGEEERQQIRWLAFVGAIAATALVGTIVTGTIVESDVRWEGSWLETVNQLLGLTLVAALGLGIPLACVVAILKYRLYELDRVVRRTVLVAILAVAITAVYIAIVVLADALVESRTANLLAAVGVAISFQPFRDRARRLADRLVYGQRATPYDVLASFTHRVGDSYAADDVLPRMINVLASAIGAERAGVWIVVAGALRPEALWPEQPMPAERPLDDGSLPTFPDEHTFEVVDEGDLLGAIVVQMPPGDPMTPQKERLARDLASQAGLVLRNVRLIEELRASRQRLVAAQDEERRKIERNLHDGAQQQLVALSVQLRLARSLVEREPAKAGELLDTVQGAANDALEDLRDLARGIYPPLLADQGLAVALEAQARKAAVPTIVEAGGVGRLPEDVESAVYFCVLEALNNIAKYAQATSATVALARTDGHLRFAVTDDGRGFDPGTTGYGTGLQGMADRLDAIGGSLEVTSTLGEGTTVIGLAPVGEEKAP